VVNFLTYYEILNIKKNATDKEIKNAYRTLAKKYHPDIYKGDKKVAEDKIKQINEAYDVLSNKKLKKEYDEQFKQSENDISSSHTYYDNNRNQSKKYQDFVSPNNYYIKKTFFEQIRGKSKNEKIIIFKIIFSAIIMVCNLISKIINLFS